MRAIDVAQEERGKDFFEHYGVRNKQELVERVKGDTPFMLQLVEDLLAEKFDTPRNVVGDATGSQTLSEAADKGWTENTDAQPETPSSEDIPAHENDFQP